MLRFTNVKRDSYDTDTRYYHPGNAEGRITQVTIDVAQQKELAQPVLEKIEAKKLKIRQDFEKAILIEESRLITIEIIRQYYEVQAKGKTK